MAASVLRSGVAIVLTEHLYSDRYANLCFAHIAFDLPLPLCQTGTLKKMMVL